MIDSKVSGNHSTRSHTKICFITLYLNLCRHLFICDGHKSNLALEFISLANDNRIDILVMPSHSSTLLQPLDNLPFRELKKNWKTSVHEWVQTHTSLDKEDFIELLRGPLHAGHNPSFLSF